MVSDALAVLLVAVIGRLKSFQSPAAETQYFLMSQLAPSLPPTNTFPKTSAAIAFGDVTELPFWKTSTVVQGPVPPALLRRIRLPAPDPATKTFPFASDVMQRACVELFATI